MEGSLPSDLSVTVRCPSKLTLSVPDASSSLTREDYKHVFRHNVTALPDECIMWTHEKHNSYLDHLETSFVKYLHRSMGMLSWCSKQNIRSSVSPEKQLGNSSNTSEQIKFLRDGHGNKIDFEIYQSQLNSTADSSTSVNRNQCRPHFQHAAKSCTLTSALGQESVTLDYGKTQSLGKRTSSHGGKTSGKQSSARHLCHKDPSGRFREISDQNFAAEDQKENPRMAKRLKIAVAGASSQDQIVPSGEVPVIRHQHKQQLHNEPLPENLDNFVCGKSEVKSLVKES